MTLAIIALIISIVALGYSIYLGREINKLKETVREIKDDYIFTL